MLLLGEHRAEKANFKFEVFSMDGKIFAIFMLLATGAVAQNIGDQINNLGDLFGNLTDVGDNIDGLLGGKFRPVCDPKIMLGSIQASVWP